MEEAFFLVLCCAKNITLCSDKVSKPGKRESLNSRDKIFAESIKKLNTTDQILKRNLYFSNKMWRAILLIFYITICKRVGHNSCSAQLPFALHWSVRRGPWYSPGAARSRGCCGNHTGAMAALAKASPKESFGNWRGHSPGCTAPSFQSTLLQQESSSQNTLFAPEQLSLRPCFSVRNRPAAERSGTPSKTGLEAEMV